MEGEDLADGFADLVAGVEGDAGALAEAAAFELEAEFEEEELFEDEAAVGGGGPVLELGHGCVFRREVYAAERGFAIGQIEALKHGGGQALGDGAAHAFEEVEDDLALPAGSESGAAEGLVDGGDAADFEQACFGVVAGVGEDLKLRLDHFEVAGGAGGLDLAEDGDGLAALEFAVEVGAVEPETLEDEAALAEGQLEDGHAAGAEDGGVADLGDDAGGFAGLELVEAAGVLAVFVAEGEMVEEVFRGGDGFGCELLGDMRADAAHELYRGIEAGH